MVGLFTKHPGSKVLQTRKSSQQDNLKTNEEAVCSFERLWFIMAVTSKCKSHKFRGKMVQEYLIVRRLKNASMPRHGGGGLGGCHLVTGRRLESHPLFDSIIVSAIKFWLDRGQRLAELTSLTVILNLQKGQQFLHRGVL